MKCRSICHFILFRYNKQHFNQIEISHLINSDSHGNAIHFDGDYTEYTNDAANSEQPITF